MADTREEQYLLRVQDEGLAQRLQDLLRGNEASLGPGAELELKFEAEAAPPPRPDPAALAAAATQAQQHAGAPLKDPKTVQQEIERELREWDEQSKERDRRQRSRGTFRMGPDRYPARLLDLPCVVESYKTFDDMHLVKTGDVGQVVLVQPPGAEMPPQLLLPGIAPEAADGVTPAMRDARQRLFASSRPDMQVEPRLLARVTHDLMSMTQGRAPPGHRYVDVEEEYIVDEDGNGRWVEVVPPPPIAAGQVGQGKAKKAAGEGSAKKSKKKKADMDAMPAFEHI